MWVHGVPRQGVFCGGVDKALSTDLGFVTLFGQLLSSPTVPWRWRYVSADASTVMGDIWMVR